MSFGNRKQLEVQCDFCGTRDSVVQYADSPPRLPGGWVSIGDKHYCIACARIIALARIAVGAPEEQTES